MTRVFFALSLFLALLAPSALLATPAFSTNQQQQVEITIDAALEVRDPSESVIDLGAGAPQQAGQGADIDSGAVNVVYLWSNTGWDSTIVADSETLSGSNQPLLQPLLYGTNDIPASTVPVGTPAAVVNDGPANTSNNAQQYSLYFRQPISWADEAGDYELNLTHGFSNS